MGRKFFSLQYKILIFSFVLFLIPILIIGIFSYRESMKIVKQKVSTTNLNTVSQVGEKIEFIFEDVHLMSLDLFKNDYARELFKLKGKEESLEISTQIINLNSSLMQLISSKPYIYSIFFKGFNGISMDTKNASNPIDKEKERKIIELKGGYVWGIDRIINYDGTSTDVFSLARVINDIHNITNRLAIMKININQEYFSEMYTDNTIGKEDSFFIIDSCNKIISATDKKKMGQYLNLDIPNSKVNRLKKGYFHTEFEGRKYLVTYYNIKNLNYKLINMIPLNELLKENKTIQRFMLGIIGISFLICVFVAFLFSMKVLSPLKKIRVEMKKVENEDFDVHIDISGNDEIAMLGRSFNKMSSRLNQLINQVYVSRIKQREAELSAIRTQINPHFLYNSLDTIYWMGRMEKAFETSKLVEALATLFRLSLNNGEEFILLGDEVEHLQNYIFIQKKRYNDSINFDIKTEEELLKCRVVKLVLQPLVENAINHGINGKNGRGSISVSIRKSGKDIVYEIKDDGAGLDVEEIETLMEKVGSNNRGFGIKNINDRLKLYFGEQYGIKFLSKKGEGTTVIVTQPIMESKTGSGREDIG